MQAQVEGRSLVPLLRNPNAPWPDRVLFTHVGRWERGQAAQAKYRDCSVRNSRWQLVCVSKAGEKQWQLFDVKADPGEKNDVAASASRRRQGTRRRLRQVVGLGAAAARERERRRAEGQPVQGALLEAVWQRRRASRGGPAFSRTVGGRSSASLCKRADCRWWSNAGPTASK